MITDKEKSYTKKFLKKRKEFDEVYVEVMDYFFNRFKRLEKKKKYTEARKLAERCPCNQVKTGMLNRIKDK